MILLFIMGGGDLTQCMKAYCCIFGKMGLPKVQPACANVFFNGCQLQHVISREVNLQLRLVATDTGKTVPKGGKSSHTY